MAFDFNPRPPWGGRRLAGAQLNWAHYYFNPRPPWGGRLDLIGLYILLNYLYFNPRPPWGGRRGGGISRKFAKYISIHALRGEGDEAIKMFDELINISIHALRGEGDQNANQAVC